MYSEFSNFKYPLLLLFIIFTYSLIGQPTHYASSSATSMYPTSTTAPTTTASSPNGK